MQFFKSTMALGLFAVAASAANTASIQVSVNGAAAGCLDVAGKWTSSQSQCAAFEYVETSPTVYTLKAPGTGWCVAGMPSSCSSGNSQDDSLWLVRLGDDQVMNNNDGGEYWFAGGSPSGGASVPVSYASNGENTWITMVFVKDD